MDNGSELILRTPKWNSLHLIFIFLNNGEMMPIIYASCIAKWENKHCLFVCLFCKYVVDGILFEMHLEKSTQS